MFVSFLKCYVVDIEFACMIRYSTSETIGYQIVLFLGHVLSRGRGFALELLSVYTCREDMIIPRPSSSVVSRASYLVVVLRLLDA